MKVSQLIFMLEKVKKQVGDISIYIVPSSKPDGMDPDIRITAIDKTRVVLMNSELQEHIKSVKHDQV